MFSVAKVVKTFGPEPGIAERLDDFRYKILNGVGCHRCEGLRQNTTDAQAGDWIPSRTSDAVGWTV
jgi:hypothetical protein